MRLPCPWPPQARLRAELALVTLLALLGPAVAQAFCGFYVAKAEAELWNQASEVVIVRDGERTVLTMSNDYQGELEEFALVVPVPVVLQEEQLHVGERAVLDHLDAYTAPRLVEYFDEHPCQRNLRREMVMSAAPAGAAMEDRNKGAAALGVTIEAEYTVGEYDILILSAEESAGLETWLRQNGYKLPEGASRALEPYIKQDLKFFVAKVNLEEQAKTGYGYLRPLQMAFESKRFMLPIRLGMLNAQGPQDLIVYLLSRKGRVETVNYRNVKIPSNVEVASFVKDEFKDFYTAMFETAWQKEGRNIAFLEYFWDMGWCDPCAADPLSPEQLRSLGVFWLDGGAKREQQSLRAPVPPRPRPVPPRPVDVVVTRLHVRYDAEHFPEDLVFRETGDRQNFQGRYILRHPYTELDQRPEWADAGCDEAIRNYKIEVRERREQQAQTTARLTGWEIADVRRKLPPLPWSAAEEPPEEEPWWRRIWKD